MKLPKIVLLAGLVVTPLAVAAIAQKNNPNQTPAELQTTPGWSAWKPEIEGIDWGFCDILPRQP